MSTIFQKEVQIVHVIQKLLVHRDRARQSITEVRSREPKTEHMVEINTVYYASGIPVTNYKGQIDLQNVQRNLSFDRLTPTSHVHLLERRLVRPRFDGHRRAFQFREQQDHIAISLVCLQEKHAMLQFSHMSIEPLRT